jgi:hypothetical protein
MTRYGPMYRPDYTFLGVPPSPPFDHAEITAMPGNRMVLEAPAGMARRRADGDGPRWNRSTPLLAGRGSADQT